MLVLVLGFFMPTMLVSCSGISGFEKSFSLADLASQTENPIIYLVLISAIVAFIATFWSYFRSDDIKTSLYIQIGSVVTGLVVLLISFLALSNEIQQNSYNLIEVKPDFGAFVLGSGLILFGFGWKEQWSHLDLKEESQKVISPDWRGVSINDSLGLDRPRSKIDEENNGFIGQTARLEPAKGILSQHSIKVDFDNFTIGRGSDNNLVIPDTNVSRHHARLRFSDGAWFIQDCDSKGGIMVNGELVPAARLNTGDKIDIVGNILIFRI
jgi:hypothetical protein